MNLTDVCLRRPVLAWMIMSGTILFGLVSLGVFPGTKGIGVSQFPDVNNPTVTVSVTWTGASPEDVETGIVNPIEDVLAQVTGVEEITSQSQDGSARITSTFSIDRDIDLAVQDVQGKIAQVQKSLPLNILPPTVSKSNPDDTPIITIGVSGPFARQLLADVARYQVEDGLATLEGVGQVQMMGYVDRAVRIWIDADKLNATSTTVADVVDALNKQHVTSSGGQMTNGQESIDIRVMGEAADLQTLRDIVVRKNGANITRLGDVALVQDGFEDITQIARMNGNPVQAMGILMQPGANAVSVANEVRAACTDIQKTLPPGMKIDVLFDTTQFIKESVNEIGLELGARRAAHRRGVLAVPRQLVVDAERAVRDPDVAARHDRGAVLPALDAQHVHVARLIARGRPRRRRRRHGDGEHLPSRRDGQRPHGRRWRRHQGDHVRRTRRDARRDRDLLAGRVHERRDRQVLLAVRRDAVGRGRDLVCRSDHAGAGALRADAAGARQEGRGRAGWRLGVRQAVARLRRGIARRDALANPGPHPRGRPDARLVLVRQEAQAGDGAAAGSEPVRGQLDHHDRRQPRRDRQAHAASRGAATGSHRGPGRADHGVDRQLAAAGHAGRPEAALDDAAGPLRTSFARSCSRFPASRSTSRICRSRASPAASKARRSTSRCAAATGRR